MKIKNLMLMMIIASTATAYAEETTNISKTPKFKVPNQDEYVIAIENSTYKDFLRLVDEQNRSKGIDSGYTKKSTKKAQRLHDDVDLIPTAHYTDDDDNYIVKYKSESNKTDSEASRSFHGVHSIANGELNIDKDSLDKMAYNRSGYQKRFYFGNGNIANEIVFLGKENFDKKVEEYQKNGGDRYLIEGAYKTIGSRNTSTTNETEKNTNLLGITMEEFYSKVDGKTRTEVAKFLKEKMEEKGVTGVIQKGDELYTTDEKGKEWKVLWNIEPISLHRVVENDFKDTVLTRIYTYVPFDKDGTKDSRGRALYTKNNDIYIEDKLSYNNSDANLKITEKIKKRYFWGEEYEEEVESIKSIEEVVKTAKEKAEKGGNPSNLVDNYFADKKNLSKDVFESKWVTPFINGTFENDLKNMKKEVEEAKLKKEIVTKEYEVAKEKVDSAEKDPDFPKDFVGWAWRFKSDAEKEAFLNTKTEKEKELINQWVTNSKIRSDKDDEKDALDSDIQYNIPGKYGFNKFSLNTNQKKWLSTVIRDADIVRNLLGKNVEFRGRGRIEGTIDLGEGDNELTIQEQMTGRYGTNIILGPYSKLKNIKIVNVGGALVASEDKPSISGKSSLTLDIDPTVKDKDGNLIQHALKDSDPNIIFKSFGSSQNLDKRNDFKIELMLSRIGENEATIDIGRKIDYKMYNLQKGELDMTIPFVSDSIVHQLSDEKKFSKNGTSLLNVKIKDEIKRLSKDENEVYRSIKNANLLGVLSPTLTTTNKKTVFTTLEESSYDNKLHKLVDYLRNKKSEEILKDLNQFNTSNIDKNKLIQLIKNIKNSKNITENLKEEKDLKEKLKAIDELSKSEDYKSANLKKVLEDLEKFDLKGMEDDKYNSFEASKLKLKTALNNIDTTILQKLKEEHKNLKFGEILTAIEVAKSDNVYTVYGFSTFLDEVKEIKELLKQQLSYDKETINKELENLDAKLFKSLETFYNEDTKDYHTLKGMLYYTMREEEVLAELKNMLHQLSDRNIYSKLNKISKNEISTYTDLPFEVDHSLTDKKTKTKGGFISNRTVQENFKGNIYTAYGLYEKEQDSGTAYGAMIGGATTKHEEVYKRTLTTVATESEVKGVSAYIGGYVNKPVAHNLEWITGLGTQYGRYNVKRDMRNTYQDLQSKGKVNTIGLNTYSGFIMTYPLQEDVTLQFKGLLAYTAIKQSKVNESGDLPLDINSKMYHYVDGEAGVSFNKVFYGDDLKSKISAGAYGILGITGYKNDDLNAKVKDSTSSFGIKGDQIKKDAVKIELDYNVQMDTGYNYGLEGTYISNSKENSVKIGVKVGYVF